MKQGYDAGLKGATHTENPYEAGSQYDSWYSGWCEGFLKFQQKPKLP